MATKKVTAVIKLQCPAGAATPAPPIGPALGPHGVSAPKFVQEFNDRTKSMEKGLVIPVVITVYQDKSYTFILKTPPAAVLIKKACKLDKGSGNPLRNKVATLSKKDLEEIAEREHIAILCPQLYDSLGKDQEHGRPFGVFVNQELPFYVRYLFGQGREIKVEVTDTI